MMKVAPSLLAANFLHLEREIRAVEEAGADLLHLDIMDGHFVPNLTFGLPLIKTIKKISRIPVDVHFMVTNPEQYLLEMAEIGVDYVSIHQESVWHLQRQISVLKSAGVKAGVALNPATPVITLYPILPELDFVLLMSVNPGFGGQKFLPMVYPKLRELKEYAGRVNQGLEIEVDGGVNNLNAPQLIELGADILVAGTYIFSHSDYKQQILGLRT
ncbi:MAG: ribulose-phosphate 3-epimerase [Candidatus Cloacimonetes bacterium]|nr:ribulose-phosphate 3-epimerase [Candidatus Cloacimonadota bacterium]